MNIAMKTWLFVLAFMVGVVLYILRHVWFATGDTLLFDLPYTCCKLAHH